MKGRLVFLLEEPSMKRLLEELLPRLFPGWTEKTHFLLVEHQGKSDLDLSVPRKLRAWQIPDDQFVILRDNDNADCVNLKARYVKLCADCGRPDTLVRLVCQELESWYLGDLVALAKAYGDTKIDTPGHRKRFADPDSWQKPSVEVARLVPAFQKGSGARLMGANLCVGVTTSASFHAFVSGLERITGLTAHS